MNRTYRERKRYKGCLKLNRSIKLRSAYKIFFKKAPRYWLGLVPINLLFVLPKERSQNYFYEKGKLCKCRRMAFYYKQKQQK